MLVPVALGLAIAHLVPADVSVEGSVVDAVGVRRDGRDQVLLSVTRSGKRALVALDHKSKKLTDVVPSVPAGAVFFDACPQKTGDDLVVLADARGLIDAAGARLVEGTTLFVVADPNALLAGDLCGKAGEARGELYVPVVDGLLVRGASGTRTLQMKHAARAYSGRVHRGLRPDRGYAEALSFYGPRLLAGDVDADGDVDLVAEREGRVIVYKRDGELADKPVLDLDLAKKIGAGDADLRVRFVDIDGDKRMDALLGVTRGAIPETSQAWSVSSTAEGPFSRAAQLWSREGLSAPLDAQKKRGLVVADVDTSLVSLSTVVITGRLPLRVSVTGASGRGEGSAVETQAKIDVRKGQMEGALPVVSIDFDGDGTADLLDLGEPGEAKLHKGTANGFSRDVERKWDVPRAAQVALMPALPGVVLIGEPRSGKTRVSVLVK